MANKKEQTQQKASFTYPLKEPCGADEVLIVPVVRIEENLAPHDGVSPSSSVKYSTSRRDDKPLDLFLDNTDSFRLDEAPVAWSREIHECTPSNYGGIFFREAHAFDSPPRSSISRQSAVQRKDPWRRPDQLRATNLPSSMHRFLKAAQLLPVNRRGKHRTCGSSTPDGSPTDEP